MNPQSYQEMCAVERNHWWFVARRSILESFIKRIFKPNQKILEIGAGTGGNLEMLSRYGKVVAIEPNDFARRKISEKFGEDITLVKGELPTALGLENQSFDLICLFDVLEHVKEDTLSLTELEKILKPQGKILITVPAFEFLWSKHDEKLHHHRRYSAASLRKIIKNSGLKITKLSYFNFFLFPLAAAVRSVSAILKLELSEEKIPNFWLNKIFTKIFACEKIWLKNFSFPIGLSLICILKKE